jgi:outer membrane receptor protein involved in Fe transport
VFAGAGADEFSENENLTWEGEAGLNWTRSFGARTELEVVGLQRYAVEEFSSAFESGGFTSAFDLEATSGESIGRAVARFRPNERWSFEGGGELAYNFLDSATAYAENGVAVPLPSSSVLVEELRGEGFGQATWRPSPRFSLEAGLRVEVSEISQSGDTDKSKSFVYPKPRVLATWSPAEGHQFRFRAERTVSQLDFGDFVASAEIDIGQVEAGNPDLEPQKSTVFEVVYERRFWGEGVLVLLASHTRIVDVIDVIPLAGGFEAVGNIGDGESDFFQARLTLPLKRLGLDGARLQGRIGLANTRVVDPLTGEERRFSGNAPFTCGLAFNHDLNGGRWAYGWDMGCTTVEYSNFRIRELREHEDEPFVTLFGQWKPSPTLRVRAEIGNAADRERRRTRFVYSGPRNTAPLLFREQRGTKMSPWLYLQVRKAF